VLVDGITDAHQLADIQEAVAAAAGYDPSRGDVISVKGMPFDRSFYEAEAEVMERAERERLYITIGKYAGLAILVVVLLLYVRGLLNSLRPAPVRVEKASLLGLPDSDRLAELSAQRSRQLSPAEVARALQTGSESTMRFEPDPRLEALIRKQSETRSGGEASFAKVGAKGDIGGDDTVDEAEQASRAMVRDVNVGDESGEAGSVREARQRLQRQVATIARSEPRAIAQVIRNWLTEGK